jgi:adenylosuccinate lyase
MLPEMGSLWSESNKLHAWLTVELAVCEAMQELNLISLEVLNKIKNGVSLNIDRMKAIEKKTHHDIIAFIETLSEGLGEESRFIHLGLTSSDILDTANALLMKRSLDLILKDIDDMKMVLKEKAFAYKDTVMIGRTHGIHAEPITLGLKFALWYSEFDRHIERIKESYSRIATGKISGAVGTYSNITPEIENIVCRKLGLNAADISTQIIQRDIYAEYMFLLALIASTIEKIATEIRNLQKTEVREVEEPFAKGQKGSSAMPHKRNPVKCEQLCGLARLVRSYVPLGLENQALWHERDISHSSAERIALPDSSIALDYMMHLLTDIVKNLLVFPDKMKSNLEILNGLIYSGGLLTELMRSGMKRNDAYALVQELAMAGWEGKNFYEAVIHNEKIKQYLPESKIKEVCQSGYYIRYRDYIFNQVFGPHDNK